MDRPRTPEIIELIARSGAFVVPCVVLDASMMGISGAAFAADERVASRLDLGRLATLRSSFNRYRPGVCNIGPEEIARRRRAGYVGTAVTIALFVVLVALDAPPIARLALALPATLAASGYLQARLKFCAGFGFRGVYNFGPLGPVEAIADPEARARDRARAPRSALPASPSG